MVRAYWLLLGRGDPGWTYNAASGTAKSVCTSINEVICHGIPDDRALVDHRGREAVTRHVDEERHEPPVVIKRHSELAPLDRRFLDQFAIHETVARGAIRRMQPVVDTVTKSVRRVLWIARVTEGAHLNLFVATQVAVLVLTKPELRWLGDQQPTFDERQRARHDQLVEDLADEDESDGVFAEMVARLIDKLGTPRIASWPQAHVYARSTDPNHRERAALWMKRRHH
jgi:hypothetical protein